MGDELQDLDILVELTHGTPSYQDIKDLLGPAVCGEKNIANLGSLVYYNTFLLISCRPISRISYPYWPFTQSEKSDCCSFPEGEGGMNTFSENGNNFGGRLLRGSCIGPALGS